MGRSWSFGAQHWRRSAARAGSSCRSSDRGPPRGRRLKGRLAVGGRRREAPRSRSLRETGPPSRPRLPRSDDGGNLQEDSWARVQWAGQARPVALVLGFPLDPRAQELAKVSEDQSCPYAQSYKAWRIHAKSLGLFSDSFQKVRIYPQ